MRRKTVLVMNGLAFLGLVFGLIRISYTQSPQQDRIADPIAGSPAVWLEGNRRPVFQPENDQGPVEDSLKLENITLVFKLTDDQQANLAALLEQQQDRSSPLYHHWLAPEQFADSFGLSAHDVAAVVAWLQSQGFTRIQTARSRRWVSFCGTAAQVQSAFHTEIHYYSVEGKRYYANASEPAVPAALADVVLGFHSLDNYRFKPRSVIRRVAKGANPNLTSYITGNNFMTPGDFAVIYDLNALYDSGIDGTGQKIAVMGQTDIVLSDITTFRSLSGLPANAPAVETILVPQETDPGIQSGDIQEASLDVEWSGAVAKMAQIIYVYGNPNNAGGVSDAFQYAVDQNIAPVISISYGGCELQGWSSSQLQQVEGWAEQANTQGQTIVSAAGDAGAADCDSSSTTILTSAKNGLAVDFPASSPFVTAMGGSEFNEGTGNYWAPAPNGVDVSPSALFYIPEKVWNDTSTTNGLLAGGGGASAVFTTKPSWQTGPGVPNDNARDVPDLSLNASPMHDGGLICVQGSCVDGYRKGNEDFTVAGGTSMGAPTFAGIVALINQQMNTPTGQGNINPTLYSMAPTSPAAFHDIITGNNIVPCTAGSTDCPASGQFGYTAGPGYDQASGLGSIDAFNLVTAWGSAGTGNLPAPTLTAPANGTNAAPLSTSFSWTPVTGAAGYRIMVAISPTLLTTNPSVATCSGCAILDTTSGNSATSYTPATGALAASTLYYWQVQALEPSTDTTGTAAWSSVFVFNTGTPDFSLGVSPSSLTIAPGGSGTSTLTLTPVDSFLPSGVTFSCSVASTLAGVTCAVGDLGGNNTATVTITASSTAMSYPALPRAPQFGGGWMVGIAMLGLLLIALTRGRQGGVQPHRWNLRHVALGALLAALLLASLSCGGGGSSGGGTPPPTGESGIVTITGTSTSATHTAQISVSVS